jgi:gliding motility-associated-like protein
MNSIKNILFIVVICFIPNVASAQYITVDDTKSAQELIETVLVNSSCANVFNFTVNGDTFSGVQNSYGYFNAGTSNFPLKEGVILSTSSSKTAIGPYVSNQNGGGNKSWIGDADLDQTLGTKSVNATVLEFDFIPLTDFISFNYIFASNEYQSYFPCEYSDGFAFLIKEAGSTDDYKNIAVIPGSDIPVSSKNIHTLINDFVDSQNITHPGCNAINESYFNGLNTASTPVNYSGQTIKMTAESDVIAGKTYHIKLVIADDGAQYYDSAVFLEAGSFSAKVDLGSDRIATNSNPICFGENHLIDTKLPADYAYEWFKDGSTIPISGESKPSITVTESGTYKVKVTFTPSVCTAEDEIKIEYAPEIVLSDATLYRCDPDGDGLSVSDITGADNIIKNNDPKLTKLVYYKSLSDAQNETNPIENPSLYSSWVATETLYARVSNAFGCTDYALLNIVLPDNPISTQNPIESCDKDSSQDGMTQFDLNAQITPQLMNGLPQGLTAEYYLTEDDAIFRKNKLPNLFTNTIPNQQIIYALIVNISGQDCYKITPETLVVSTFDPSNFQDETIGLCNGANRDLTVDSGFTSYLWSNGDTTNTINVTAPGKYTVTVTNPKGCQKTKEYTVQPSGIATITNISVGGFAGAENYVTLSYSGLGNYEFSLDGNSYQDSPTFTGLDAGIYWATARDKNGCGVSAPNKVYIIDYPRFFTPNNDNFNDTWKIKNLELLPKSTITIFDRYGKLLKELNPASNGWNGLFNGKELPSDDYWFAITFEDGKTLKGHFSLKR